MSEQLSYASLDPIESNWESSVGAPCVVRHTDNWEPSVGALRVVRYTDNWEPSVGALCVVRHTDNWEPSVGAPCVVRHTDGRLSRARVLDVGTDTASVFFIVCGNTTCLEHNGVCPRHMQLSASWKELRWSLKMAGPRRHN